MCVSKESDLIDNTKIANYRLFKYTMNCGNSESRLRHPCRRRQCLSPSDSSGLAIPDGYVLSVSPDGLVLPVRTRRTGGGHQRGAGRLG